MSQELWGAFSRVFDVPSVAVPFIGAIFSEEEIRLVLAADGRPLTVDGAAQILKVDSATAESILFSAYCRGIFDRDEQVVGPTYSAKDFYSRLDMFATYEDWRQLPLEARRALDEWMLNRYAAEVKPNVDRLSAGLAPERSPGNDSILLLSELDAIVDSATTIAVFPCNCRTIAGYCDRPTEVCLHFDDEAERKLSRGHGRRVSHEEAKELLRHADRKGLMHTTDLQPRPSGPAPICNCCGDDCYVFRAATRMGTKGVWPRQRYVASYDPQRCDLCGACVRRCHFGAFALAGEEAPNRRGARPPMQFDAGRCWGCGLCANSCPRGAIEMRRLHV